MPYCQNCGAHYKEGANFCPECGEPIEEKEVRNKNKGVSQRLGFWGTLGIFVMVIGFIIGWIGFMIGNSGAGFGGIKTVVIGLIIFMVAKWRNKRAFIVSGGIIVGWVLFSLISSAWQNRAVEIKEISGEKCIICGVVVSAETTIVEKSYKEVKNKDFIYTYKGIICDSCALVGKKSYKEGKIEYAKGNYILARNKFLDAQKRGIKDAKTWAEKANKKIEKIKERVKNKAEREAGIRKRAKYEKLARESFLDKGWDIKVRVHGPDNKYITFTWALMGDVFIHNFEKSPMFDEMYKLGFRRIYYKDDYNFSKYTYWKE